MSILTQQNAFSEVLLTGNIGILSYFDILQTLQSRAQSTRKSYNYFETLTLHFDKFKKAFRIKSAASGLLSALSHHAWEGVSGAASIYVVLNLLHICVWNSTLRPVKGGLHLQISF